MARYKRLRDGWNPDAELEATYFERNVHAFPFSSSTSFVGACWRAKTVLSQASWTLINPLQKWDIQIANLVHWAACRGDDALLFKAYAACKSIIRTNTPVLSSLARLVRHCSHLLRSAR